MRADLEAVIGRHLWLHSSRRCSCGVAPLGPRGTHYAWHIEHLAERIILAGLVAA